MRLAGCFGASFWRGVISTLALSFPAAQALAEPVRFVAFGDAPYVAEAKVERAIGGLIDAINRVDPPLVIHVGDTQGGQPCTNSMTDTQRRMMNRLRAPVLYTPGDNEWRDCVDSARGEQHKFDRLAYIRETNFATGRTLGAKTLPVENQGKRGYPENARLMMGDVAFITAHVVGSNNNYDPNSALNTQEYYARDRANIDWIRDSFARYADAEAFVVAVHADMYSGFSGYTIGRGWSASSPFVNFGLALHRLSNEYEKPVLVLFGDSHAHRVLRPASKEFPFVTGIEVHGYPNVKAIEIEVDATAKRPFRVIRKITKGG